MYKLKATARQTRSGIDVRITGWLADSCGRAKIVGTYPGNIIHLVDPGYAEVYINEWSVAGPCTDGLVKWEGRKMIRDFKHRRVAILVNGTRKITVPVIGAAATEKAQARILPGRNWIVTALVGPTRPPYSRCVVRPKGAPFPFIYRKVFGPNTFLACQLFRVKNCRALRV